MEDTPENWARLEREFSIGCSSYNSYKYESESPLKTFATLGAKNYSYETEEGKKVVKIRGFCLRTAVAESKINHEIMRELLLKYLKGEADSVTCPAFRMVVNRKTATVRNSSVVKKYANNLFDKRVVLPETETAATVPFGLVHYNFTDMNRDLILPPHL